MKIKKKKNNKFRKINNSKKYKIKRNSKKYKINLIYFFKQLFIFKSNLSFLLLKINANLK